MGMIILLSFLCTALLQSINKATSEIFSEKKTGAVIWTLASWVWSANATSVLCRPPNPSTRHPLPCSDLGSPRKLFFRPFSKEAEKNLVFRTCLHFRLQDWKCFFWCKEVLLRENWCPSWSKKSYLVKILVEQKGNSFDQCPPTLKVFCSKWLS